MPKRKKAIGLISAVAFESALIRRRAEGRRALEPGIWAGRLASQSVVHVRSGVGTANAAWAATVLMERYKVSKVINFGIAGAYPGSGLKLLDVAAAEEEGYADAGIALAGGVAGMKEMGLGMLRRGSRVYYDSFPMDRGLLSKALGCVDASGRFLTVAQATGTSERARELQGRFGAIAENMEGAAVAHVAARYGVPALELRGISNFVEDRDTDRWEKTPAAKHSQEALMEVLGLL